MDLPRNLEAERALLGMIINRNNLLFDVSQIVSKDDFYEPWNAELFTLLRDQIEMARVVTADTLLHGAQDAVVGENTKASELIARLAREAPDDPGLAAGFARVIRDTALRRRLIEAADQMRSAAINAPVSVTADELRTEWDGIVTGLFTSAVDLGLRKLSEVNDAILERLKDDKTKVGIPPGLTGLQNLIGPLMPGKLYVIGGGPGSGKSSLVAQVLHFAAKQGNEVILFTPEMDPEEVAGRILGAETGIGTDAIERSLVDNRQYEALWQTAQGMAAAGLWIDRGARPSLRTVRTTCLRKKRLDGLAIAAVDHIHYMEKPDRRQSEHEALDENLMGLKSLAKELGIAVIVVGQFTGEGLRELARWPHPRPTQASLLYSGVFDRHADVIVLVHRQEYMLQRNEPDREATHMGQRIYPLWEAKKMDPKVANRAELILTKRRGGKGWGSANVGFDAARTRFNDKPVPAVAGTDLFA